MSTIPGYYIVIAIWLLVALVMYLRHQFRKRLKPPHYRTASAQRYNLPPLESLWGSTTIESTTTEGVPTIPEPAPTQPPAETMPADVAARVDNLVAEMNSHLNAARFNEAMALLGEVNSALSTLPPGQRNFTTRRGNAYTSYSSTVITTTTPSQAPAQPASTPEEPKADPKAKTRFDYIG